MIICLSVSRCVHSGTVAIFQPLSSCVWPEGLRFELERNLFSSSRHRRILLPSASSPSPERLSGRKAVRHVTKQRRENFLELVCKIQTLARSLWWLLVRSLFGSVSRQRQFSSVNFDLLFFNSLIMVMMWILHFLITWLTSLTWISNINIFFYCKIRPTSRPRAGNNLYSCTSFCFPQVAEIVADFLWKAIKEIYFKA